MKEYKALLIDLDDTILDFKQSEKYAICKLLEHFGFEQSDKNIEIYHNINLSYWKKLELGLVNREELILLRFIDLFTLFGKEINIEEAKKVNDLYFDFLSSKAFVINDADSVIYSLKKKYKIYLITNGVKRVQDKRLNLIPSIKECFDKIFISEEIGYTKPDQEFANFVLNVVGLDKKDCLIIGDSLSSDMKLGLNAGIDTCWYNPNKKESDCNLTYIIKDINELLNIL